MAAADNIGDGGGANLNPADWEKIRKVRRLRELYHGRFTGLDSTTLLRHHQWDMLATNTFILNALPDELSAVLGENNVVENVRRNNVLQDLARLDRIGIEVRLFGCKSDDNVWWRRVPARKPVSECHRCKEKYDPIPRDQEWGWASFKCDCTNEFNAFGMMDTSMLGPNYTGKSKSLCYRCTSHLCEPIQILPPMRNRTTRDGTGPRPRRYTHRCTAPNCFNRYERNRTSNEPPVLLCVHPRSLNENVHGLGSDRHVSTGSTVRTFLSQDDLVSTYEPSLSVIGEDVSGDDDNM